MSFIGDYSRMIYGGPGDESARASAGANHQNIPERVIITTRRQLSGPWTGGRYSLHLKNFTGVAPVGSLTVWYSNLPNPSLASDADWVQDTNIVAVDLAVVANTFVPVGNIPTRHIMVKVERTSGSIDLVVWAFVSAA